MAGAEGLELVISIQEQLGHSTFNFTANFYSNLDYNSKISSAEIIARGLGNDVTASDETDDD